MMSAERTGSFKVLLLLILRNRSTCSTRLAEFNRLALLVLVLIQFVRTRTQGTRRRYVPHGANRVRIRRCLMRQALPELL